MKQSDYNESKDFRDAIRTAMQPWVQWKHISMGMTHCYTCLKLDMCWFVRSNMPAIPQHMYCHCIAIPISTQTVQKRARAICAYEKFAKYVLDPSNPQNKGKAEMFASWGYTVEDSNWLLEEFQRQARDKYISGEYTLGELNLHGQRINIQITIPIKNKTDTATFRTGWLAEPGGKIRMVTPYGGKQ